MKKNKPIEEIRLLIDEIDMKILELISKRKELVVEVVKFKNRNQIVDQKRIEKILQRLNNKAKELDLPPQIVDNIWKSMINSFIELEEKIFDEVNKN